MYILKTESGNYLNNENEFGVTKVVKEIEKATTFSYHDAIIESNLYFQISDVKTILVKRILEFTFQPNYQSEY